MTSSPARSLLTRTPSRRGVLRGGLLTGAGAVAVIGLRTASSDAALAAVTGCTTLTPELTQGPFWVDEKLNRSDVRADSDTGAVQSGIPLSLTIKLTDATGACTPQAGAYVDIWHANAQGAYSDVSGQGNPDNRGVDWLRGYQVSDAGGAVTFTTIFPGWYSGRTMHIHFRVRKSLDSSTTVNFTSQLFFEESVDAAVAGSSGYTKSGTRTTNSTDGIYDASMVVPLTGSTSSGYTGTFTANLDFGDGASTSSSSSSSALVDASLVSAEVVRRGGRRVVRATMTSGEAVTARLRLVRHDDVLARKQWGWLPTRKRRTLVVAVPRSVPAGPARVALLVADRAGHTRTERVRVHVPAR